MTASSRGRTSSPAATASAFHFFVDLNGAFHSRDWRESSYEPLRKMAATVERDELGHSEMGYHFLREICSEPRGKELAQRLLAKWYPAALDMFGRSGSPNVPKFIHWGLKTIGNAQIRDLYTTYVDRKITGLGLDLPDERKHRKFSEAGFASDCQMLLRHDVLTPHARPWPRRAPQDDGRVFSNTAA